MAEDHEPASAPILWQVPIAVEDVAEVGEHLDLAADAQTRAAVARMAGLRDLPRFEAAFDVSRHGQGGLRVVGKVSATVGQTCVVTLEPLANEVTEDVDLLYVPQAPAQNAVEDGSADSPADDKTEPLISGSVDLGALATEFLILGLDPYPRKPGAIFQPPADAGPGEGPFAALGALKKGRDGA
jgi:Large ribosomal RNA subunit accumulation protein YceD